jgi:hypothetical protein
MNSSCAAVAVQLDFLFFSVGDYRFAQALACRLPNPDITGKQVDSDSRFPPATGQEVPRPLSVIP